MSAFSRLFRSVRQHILRSGAGLVNKPGEDTWSIFSGKAHATSPLLFYKGRSGKLTYKTNATIVPDLVIDESFASFGETSQRIITYLGFGVKTVVICDEKNQNVHTYRIGNVPLLHQRKTALTIDALPKFSIDLTNVFVKPPQKPLRPTRTLFDPDTFAQLGTALPFMLKGRVSEQKRLIESDVEKFEDLTHYDLPRRYKTSIAGPITLKISGQRVDCAKPRRKPVDVYGWTESDRIQFQSARAAGILFIEIGSMMSALTEIRAWEKLGLILVCGYGLPRPATLRLLHRMSVELKLPVFTLTDNDTWGYFIYSILKRGSVVPHESVPQFAIEDVRFLGHRAGELRRNKIPASFLIKWNPYWDLRLKAMSKYDCFRSAGWKKEFLEFRKQNGKYEGIGFACGIAGRNGNRLNRWRAYVAKYLVPKLANQDWLT